MCGEGKGGGGGGGPQRMIDEEELTMDAEQERRCRGVKEAQPTWIKLGLGIGSDSAAAKSPVTAQLHELQGQTLIYKYLEAGLPVPLHLLVPIWKSVACIFGPAIYKLYPSYHMDPEPGRCRRTDGKKLRYSKHVVPDQKYRERHMHRGCQRSRKPVEAFEISSPSNSIPPDKLGELNSNRQFSHFFPPTSSNIRSKKYVSSDTITTRTPIPAIAATMTTIFATAATRATTLPTFTANSIKSINHASERKDVSGNPLIYSLSMKSNGNRVVSPGLGFSPKNVLQGDAIELELERCRRTDGKKWRCNWDIVLDRKYCVQHMRRGAKKRVSVTKKSMFPQLLPVLQIIELHHLFSINVPNEAGLSSLNTDLFNSIQASSQLVQIDEKSTTSSSIDTTMTDTSITANEYGYISS
ncbi:hypothetical protein I3842_01G261900 [Carya illinoinensis]|uniref:Growth-regulating factor n=1 Tax=Carya illinoinensis TaxID=32201 RepID=A0A922K8L0_CARIL|nr:hypothetical protein I3842_01G261900 [Carya illinoinensis]